MFLNSFCIVITIYYEVEMGNCAFYYVSLCLFIRIVRKFKMQIKTQTVLSLYYNNYNSNNMYLVSKVSEFSYLQLYVKKK